MYENSIQSSANELLGKPILHDPLCKLFFEQLFDSYVINYVYMFVIHNETLLVNCN